MLSYVRWDQARLLAALKQSPVSVKLILGDRDDMMERGWFKALALMEVPLVIVKGANHFMDGAHEFDLLEHTLESLDAIQQAPSR